MKITYEELVSNFSYCKETGVFSKKTNTAKNKAGNPIGTIKKSGYVVIHIKNNVYLAHRLAWLYCYGEFPSLDIDHINGIRGDNRIENLRLSTKSGNVQNKRKAHSNSATGVLGVSRSGKKFRSHITVNGKFICLGTYSNIDDAYEAYVSAKRVHHEFCTI